MHFCLQGEGVYVQVFQRMVIEMETMSTSCLKKKSASDVILDMCLGKTLHKHVKPMVSGPIQCQFVNVSVFENPYYVTSIRTHGTLKMHCVVPVKSFNIMYSVSIVNIFLRVQIFLGDKAYFGEMCFSYEVYMSHGILINRFCYKYASFSSYIFISWLS